MKTKIVTPKELYNIVKQGQLFYLVEDDEDKVLNACKHLVLSVERFKHSIRVVSLINEYSQIKNDIWTQDLIKSFNSEKRFIQLVYS